MSRHTAHTGHPDWERLVARRAAGGREPAVWADAVTHMESCEPCRRAALAADPTLVFRRLPAPATDAADADAMRRAVASLRRASRVAPAGAGAPPSAGGRLSLPERLRRVPAAVRNLAAAVLLVAAGGGALMLGGLDPADGAGGTVAPPAVTRATGGGEGLWRSDAPTVRQDAGGQQVFEGLSAPRTADVYQAGEGDMTVVMVVDENLDI